MVCAFQAYPDLATQLNYLVTTILGVLRSKHLQYLALAVGQLHSPCGPTWQRPWLKPRSSAGSTPATGIGFLPAPSDQFRPGIPRVLEPQLLKDVTTHREFDARR